MKKGAGYGYYRSADGSIGFDRKSIRGARQLSQHRLNPSLDDVDYLVYKLRLQRYILRRMISIRDDLLKELSHEMRSRFGSLLRI